MRKPQSYFKLHMIHDTSYYLTYFLQWLFLYMSKTVVLVICLKMLLRMVVISPALLFINKCGKMDVRNRNWESCALDLTHLLWQQHCIWFPLWFLLLHRYMIFQMHKIYHTMFTKLGFGRRLLFDQLLTTKSHFSDAAPQFSAYLT